MLKNEVKDLQANRPHTLADFVRYTQKMGIVVTGLPEGSLAESARKFEEIGGTIQLAMSSAPYFHGNWLHDGWKREVVTTEGTALFTITVDNRLESFHFKLNVEESALRLL